MCAALRNGGDRTWAIGMQRVRHEALHDLTTADKRRTAVQILHLRLCRSWPRWGMCWSTAATTVRLQDTCRTKHRKVRNHTCLSALARSFNPVLIAWMPCATVRPINRGWWLNGRPTKENCYASRFGNYML